MRAVRRSLRPPGTTPLSLSSPGLRRARIAVLLVTAALLPIAPAALPAPAIAAECNGDECQGPPPAPEEVTPGTAVVQGPPNPPVRFPAHHKKKRHKHRKHYRHHQVRG
jgi:hypothetical protein